MNFRRTAGALFVTEALLSTVPFAVMVPTVTAIAFNETKLRSSDWAPGDVAGISVAADGSTLLVGDHRDDGGRGSAYVFVRSGDEWAQQAKLTANERKTDSWFGRSVAIDGDTAIVGAALEDDWKGAAYVFGRTGSTWTQQARLTGSIPSENGAFGMSVAIDGNLVLVGAPKIDGSDGAAYVFVRTGSNWDQWARLTEAGLREVRDWFGFSVAIDGDTSIVGAHGDEYYGYGSAFVFVQTGSTWSQQAKLTANARTTADLFGFSVDVQGNTAIVGAREGGAWAQTGSGAAYVFTQSGSTWTQQAKLKASDGQVGDGFGWSISFDGDTVVVGAPHYESLLVASTGSAYVFVRTGSAWTQQAKLTASDSKSEDAFGFSVALSGCTVVVGAFHADGFRGGAYVYECDMTPPETVIEGALDGEGSPVSNGGQTGSDEITFSFFGTMDFPLNFQCRLGGSLFWTFCSSPKTYSGLSRGTDTFEVRAIDRSGNADPTPASWTWTVLTWTDQFGTPVHDRATGIAVHPSGVYVVGWTSGTLSDQSFGGQDAFLRKYDFDGNEVWTRQFGTASNDYATGVAARDGIYIVGWTSGSLSEPSLGGQDGFLIEYGFDGTVVRTCQFGTSVNDQATGIAIDSSGAIYLSGWTEGALAGATSAGLADAFVLKTENSCTAEWTRQFGTPTNDKAMAIAVSRTGGVYLAGWTEGMMPSQRHQFGAQDAFVRMYNATGSEIWTEQFGTSLDDQATAVTVDSAATPGVYLGGWTEGTLPGKTSAGLRDAFVRRYDVSGNGMWSQQFGTPLDDEVAGLAADSLRVYSAGWTEGGLFGQTSTGLKDGFVREQQPSGAEVSFHQFGTSIDDEAAAIAVDGFVFVAGWTQGVFSGQVASGGDDSFVKSFVK